ncbi:hypothetical protein SAMN05421593_3633 [Chryseobacterium culicis]|uniref:Uncharacterized protein n=2 Tax=Chryseobacterium culicis TaxID=680127 RepID=A0A1H6HYW4_CHRCI|nr:hypothetical protein SAMN05421593_3633 [Chryseobacterium culicis]
MSGYRILAKLFYKTQFMRKFLIGIFLLGTLGLKAQFGSLNEILNRLEQRKGINQHLENVNIDNKKFVFIKDEADHTERDFIIIKGNNATYVEVFDDKATGESSSNVFSGDIIRKKNIISLRADMLENKKIPMPVTKTLLLTQQDNILYLIDVNTKDRWIDETSFSKKAK